MLLGFTLILAGIVVAGAGVRVALERPRPLNLAGMLLAPVGLCVALLGVGRTLSPTFFGRAAGARGGVLRIMPAGDSITRGTIGVASDAGGYRGPLWKRLEEAKRPVDFVGATRSGPFAIDRDCEAWDGVTVDELAGRVFRDLSVYAPEVILLHVGTNDVIQRATPDVIAGRLAALIDGVIARAPHVQLLVASLAGVRASNAYRVAPESISATNARLRAVVTDRSARGGKVRFVDVHARVGRTASHFAGDGLHLDERGHSELAQVWWEALQPLLPAAPAP